MCCTHLVPELKTRKILRLQRFHQGTPQGYDPLGAALGGVNALFWPPIQRLHRLSQRGAAHVRPARRGQPHPQLVPGGTGLLVQASPNPTRAGVSRHGASRCVAGTFSEPLVRWWCRRFSIKETDTLNRTATWRPICPVCPQATATRSRRSNEYAFMPKDTLRP